MPAHAYTRFCFTRASTFRLSLFYFKISRLYLLNISCRQGTFEAWPGEEWLGLQSVGGKKSSRGGGKWVFQIDYYAEINFGSHETVCYHFCFVCLGVYLIFGVGYFFCNYGKKARRGGYYGPSPHLPTTTHVMEKFSFFAAWVA